MLMRIFNKLKKINAYSSPSRYVKYLRKHGCQIGNNFAIYGKLKSISIDLTRPSLVTIGDNVSINSNFSLMTHDFVSGVFLHLYNDFIPSSGAVKIGNNVSFGINCTVLKGVTIGDNCFIAAGAVVTRDIPANCIAGGVPAKVICSIEDYYNKRQELCIKEAFTYARSITERYGRKPVPADFWEEFPLFVDAHNINDYPEIPIKRQLFNDSIYQKWMRKHHAVFASFEDFIKAAFDI